MAYCPLVWIENYPVYGFYATCLNLYEHKFSFKIDVDDCIQAKQNLDSNAQHKIYIRQTINCLRYGMFLL